MQTEGATEVLGGVGTGGQSEAAVRGSTALMPSLCPGRRGLRSLP